MMMFECGHASLRQKRQNGRIAFVSDTNQTRTTEEEEKIAFCIENSRRGRALRDLAHTHTQNSPTTFKVDRKKKKRSRRAAFGIARIFRREGLPQVLLLL